MTQPRPTIVPTAGSAEPAAGGVDVPWSVERLPSGTWRASLGHVSADGPTRAWAEHNVVKRLNVLATRDERWTRATAALGPLSMPEPDLTPRWEAILCDLDGLRQAAAGERWPNPAAWQDVRAVLEQHTGLHLLLRPADLQRIRGRCNAGAWPGLLAETERALVRGIHVAALPAWALVVAAGGLTVGLPLAELGVARGVAAGLGILLVSVGAGLVVGRR